MATQGDTLSRLQACLADLDGYITRRAEDLAAPMIRDAEARARLSVIEARGEVQRERDLVAELRRRLQAADRRQEEMRNARERLAAALGRKLDTTPLSVLIGEVETALAAKNAALERLRPDVRIPRDAGQVVKTLVSIYGERQIETFETMCYIRGRRPHELAADILLDAIREAQHDHETQELVEARKARDDRA